MIERFLDGATYAGKVAPEDLSKEERLQILKGALGYCEAHEVLYRREALHSCLVPLVFEGGLGVKCREWPSHE